MKSMVLIACAVTILIGCKSEVQKPSGEQRHNSRPAAMDVQIPTQAVPKPDVAAWNPVTKGVTYQLSLKSGAFTFCDNTGPQTINLETGRQTMGAFTCDRKNDAVKTGCDNGIDIIGPPDEPYDVVSGFKLHGHVRDCDNDGNLIIVSTTGEIVIMDTSANKLAFVEATVPNTVVIGSGWSAWNSQDKQVPVHLEKISALLQKALTPHYD